MKKFFCAFAFVLIASAGFSQQSTGFILSDENNTIETKKVIDALFEESKSLKDIETIIKLSFEQMGDETISDDGKFVSTGYYNGAFIMTLVTHSRVGVIDQISFVMEEAEALSLFEALDSKYGGSGFLLLITDNLSYEYRKGDEASIIVIRNSLF